MHLSLSRWILFKTDFVYGKGKESNLNFVEKLEGSNNLWGVGATTMESLTHANMVSALSSNGWRRALSKATTQSFLFWILQCLVRNETKHTLSFLFIYFIFVGHPNPTTLPSIPFYYSYLVKQFRHINTMFNTI